MYGIFSTPYLFCLYIDNARLALIITKQLQRQNDQLNDFLKHDTLKTFAYSLYSIDIITADLRDNPEYNQIERQFSSSLKTLEKTEEVEEHCKAFINGLVRVGGPGNCLADKLKSDWSEKVNSELLIRLKL